MERALHAIATLNHKNLHGFNAEFCENVQKHLLISLDSKFPSAIISCISKLAVLGVANEKLVDWALNPNIYTNIATTHQREHDLLLIDAYAKINLPKTYVGHKLPDKICAELMTIIDKKAVDQQSDVVNEIRSTLKMHGIHSILVRPFPYVPFQDIFLVYNKRTNTVLRESEGNANGRIFAARQLHRNNPDLEAVAIVPCLQRQTVFNSNRYTGFYQFKLHQLHAQGFKTVVIKQQAWTLYKTKEAKRRFLSLEFAKNDVFVFNKNLTNVF